MSDTTRSDNPTRPFFSAVSKEPTTRLFDIPWMVSDTTRAGQQFDWRSQTPLINILEEIANHADANPQWLDWTAG
jgi:CDP-paratose 2-epimerase